jgi:hypothetical protein
MTAEIRHAEYGERISTTGGSDNRPYILNDDPCRRYASGPSKEGARVMTTEILSNQAGERIMQRVERMLNAHESLEAPRLAALLNAAQTDETTRQVASHKWRINSFLVRFEDSSEEVLLDLRETFEAMLRTAVAIDGPRAFESPRSRAIAHFSGQGVVYASFGNRVSNIEIALSNSPLASFSVLAFSSAATCASVSTRPSCALLASSALSRLFMVSRS